MNDEEQLLLASAYLDGAVDDDERVIVESSDELLQIVARLRPVRVLVGDLDDPTISVRERHLSNALEAWERLPLAERTGAARDATPAGADRVAAAAATAAVTRNAKRASKNWAGHWPAG